jgi:hypothetical protein
MTSVQSWEDTCFLTSANIHGDLRMSFPE